MGEGRYSQLPDPVRLEDTITSEDVQHEEPIVDLLADAWLIRNAAG